VRYFLFLLLSGVLSLQSVTDVLADSSPKDQATVFIYHKFAEPRYPTTNVSRENFIKELRYLRDNNYSVLPLADIVTALREKRPLGEKVVAITIDDGYKSTYSVAWPLLKEFSYPFTVFLYVEAVERGYKNFLTWDEIGEMAAAGVDFEDHGYAHHRFGGRPRNMDDAAYGRWVENDLHKGREILSRHLGRIPTLLALPYGEYNEVVSAAAKRVGYLGVFTQDPGSISRDSDLFSIPREPILGRDWATMDHFKMVLNRHDLPFNNMRPQSADLTAPRVEKFCADLLHPERYLPGSLEIYVSELGWAPATMVENTLCRDNPGAHPLQRRGNRVAVKGREKDGSAAFRSWLIIDRDAPLPEAANE